MTERSLALMFLLTSQLAHSAQVRRAEGRLPDSPRGRMANALAELIGERSDEALKSFMEERVAPHARETIAADLAEFHKELRGGELEAAEITGPVSARVRFVSGNATASVTYTVEEEAPHRLVAFGLGIDVGGPAGMAGGGGFPPVEPSDDEPAVVTQRYFERLAAEDRFSGSLLVADGDEIRFQGAFGLADRAKELPIHAETKFDVGSITKAVTQVAIGQLARDGKLELDDVIADHLPDYPNRDVAGKVTVQHLLDHRSGLGDIFTPAFKRTPKETLLTPKDFFPLFVDDPLGFEPGASQSYSNAGYIVLGAIVEAASGQSYIDYVMKHVFAPAGMKDSGFFMRDGSRNDLAIGYTREGGGALKPNQGMLPIRGCPAGSSSHTAKDLWLFAKALHNGTLLGPEWTSKLFGSGRMAVGGGGPGVNAILDSDGDRTMVVLANMDSPVARQSIAKLKEIWN